MVRAFLSLSLAFVALPAWADEGFVAEGKIREVTGPGRSRAMLITDDNKSFTLESRSKGLNEELVRMSGIKVRLRAEARPAGTPEGVPLQVEGYDILDVGGGVVPTIGYLAMLEGGSEKRMIFVTEDGRANLLPRTWTQRLVSHLGAKVWLVAQKEKDELVVRRFSILRVPRPGASTRSDSP
jgi:hypothetical protein